ncbi:MAG: PilN domain-containing protein [Acidobacteria bacterium]|nr:PilN domain-containing protein [Planctomycetota bacterium]MBE3133827.1 PilN domain-containing protein [Acidobacteriota bacterium]
MRELEFLPDDYTQARFKRRIGFIRSWLLLAMGLAMVLWSLQMGVWVRDARAELQSLRGTGSAMDGDVQKVRMLRAEAQHFYRRLELLRTLRPQTTVAAVVAGLVDVLPAHVVLDAIELSQPETEGDGHAVVRLSGTAPRETTVTDTLGMLDASPQFDRVTLVESKPAASEIAGQRQFIIEVEVLPAEPAQEK